MATLVSLRGQLRVDLHDQDAASYRWTDAELDRHLQRANRELSVALPRERMSVVLTGAGSRDLDIGTPTFEGLVRVYAVEYPVNEFPPCYVQFQTWQTTLTLQIDKLPVADENVRIFWGSVHVVDEDTSTVPAFAEEALLHGAGGYAALEWASFASSRANVGGSGAVLDYRFWGEARLNAFRDQLRRIGERARVRSSRLYSPEQAAAHGDVVTWEP